MIDPETEEIVDLADRISELGPGYTNNVVVRAALNVCATVVVRGCNTREEAQMAADLLAADLVKGIRHHWAVEHPN